MQMYTQVHATHAHTHACARMHTHAHTHTLAHAHLIHSHACAHHAHTLSLSRDAHVVEATVALHELFACLEDAWATITNHAANEITFGH